MKTFNKEDKVIISIAGSQNAIDGIIVKPVGTDCYIVSVDDVNVICHESQLTLSKKDKYNIGNYVYFRATIPVVLKGVIIAKEGKDYIIDAVDDINIDEDTLKCMKVDLKDIIYKTIV